MVLPGAAFCPFQGPAPSRPCESHLPVGGRGSHGDQKELCLLRPRWLQCQRKGAFKGHFWLGWPAHPQIQNKNRSSAPDGLVSPAPQKGLIESEGRVARGHIGQGTQASGSVWPTLCGPGLVPFEMGGKAPWPPLAKQGGRANSRTAPKLSLSGSQQGRKKHASWPPRE